MAQADFSEDENISVLLQFDFRSVATHRLVEDKNLSIDSLIHSNNVNFKASESSCGLHASQVTASGCDTDAHQDCGEMLQHSPPPPPLVQLPPQRPR